MDVEKSFNESVYEVCDTPETEGQEIPTINDGQVEFYLKKIKALQEDAEGVSKIAKDEIGKIQVWMATEMQTLEKKRRWYEQVLQQYATIKLEGKEKKSISFPSGKMGFTKQQPEYLVNDENLLNFAKSNCPEFIKVTEKVEWGAMKKTLHLAGDNKLVTDDGQIVEGVTYMTRPDKFSVKVS